MRKFVMGNRNTLDMIRETAAAFNIPAIDALLIWLNVVGARLTTSRFSYGDRLTFELNLDPLSQADADFIGYPANDYYFTLCLYPDSPFELDRKNKLLRLDGELVGNLEKILNTHGYLLYTRDEGRVLHLDPRLKDSCSGCDFCHFAAEDAISLDEHFGDPIRHVRWSIDQYEKILPPNGLKSIKQVAIVSGCFPSVDHTLDYLRTVRREFDKIGFTGEIFYLGSDLRVEHMPELARIAPVTYCHSIECFSHRAARLHPKKAALSLPEIFDILRAGKSSGVDTTFTYILGMDGLEEVLAGMQDSLDALTRIPVVNIFHRIKREHDQLWAPGADQLSYYLRARQELGQLFDSVGFADERPWENCRGLWYTAFEGRPIMGSRLPGRYRVHYKRC